MESAKTYNQLLTDALDAKIHPEQFPTLQISDVEMIVGKLYYYSNRWQPEYDRPTTLIIDDLLQSALRIIAIESKSESAFIPSRTLQGYRLSLWQNWVTLCYATRRVTSPSTETPCSRCLYYDVVSRSYDDNYSQLHPDECGLGINPGRIGNDQKRSSVLILLHQIAISLLQTRQNLSTIPTEDDQ